MRPLLTLCLLLTMAIPLPAQDLNASADNIIGSYYLKHKRDEGKVRFYKTADGTYTCHVYWLKYDRDENGNKLLDIKNPDRSLRSVPCDQMVLIRGLRYNANKRQWDGAKIYDSQRGIKANVTVCFTEDGRLRLRGTVLGIGETIYWQRIDE